MTIDEIRSLMLYEAFRYESASVGVRECVAWYLDQVAALLGDEPELAQFACGLADSIRRSGRTLRSERMEMVN